MKYLLFLLLPLTAVAQPTSEEEYNYVRLGYHETAAKGLDPKKGYTMKDLNAYPLEFGDGSRRSVTLKGLYRDGSATPCALLMTFRGKDGSVTHFCVPTADASPGLWQQTNMEVMALLSDWNSAQVAATLMNAMMRFSAEQMVK